MQFDRWSLCCSSSLTAAAAMLQLGALTLSYSCAGEIIRPLGAPALPTHSVIRLHHLHHSRTGSRIGGNGRGRTKGRVSPESVYMLLRCLSDCAHTKGLLPEQHAGWEISTDWAVMTALFPRIKVKLIKTLHCKTSKKGLTQITQPKRGLRWCFQPQLSAPAFIRNRRLCLLPYRQRLSLASTGDKREPLRFDGDAGLLYVLFNIPKKEKHLFLKCQFLTICIQ